MAPTGSSAPSAEHAFSSARRQWPWCPTPHLRPRRDVALCFLGSAWALADLEQSAIMVLSPEMVNSDEALAVQPADNNLVRPNEQQRQQVIGIEVGVTTPGPK